MLNTGFGTQGFEFLYEREFCSASAEDEFWAAAFARFGGAIVISADKNIAKRPHQIMAFKDNGLVCFFFESKWAQMDTAFKAAHIVYWWPRIQSRIESSKRGDCWWVPMPIAPAEFRAVQIPTSAQDRPATRSKVI